LFAATAILDRGLGKPKEGPSEENESDEIDLAHLTPEERGGTLGRIGDGLPVDRAGLAPVPQVQIYLPYNGRDDSGASHG